MLSALILEFARSALGRRGGGSVPLAGSRACSSPVRQYPSRDLGRRKPSGTRPYRGVRALKMRRLPEQAQVLRRYESAHRDGVPASRPASTPTAQTTGRTSAIRDGGGQGASTAVSAIQDAGNRSRVEGRLPAYCTGGVVPLEAPIASGELVGGVPGFIVPSGLVVPSLLLTGGGAPVDGLVASGAIAPGPGPAGAMLEVSLMASLAAGALSSAG